MPTTADRLPGRQEPATPRVRAVTATRYGGPEVVEVGTRPAPSAPGPGQVRLRVEAVGLAAGDVALLQGRPLVVRTAFGLRRPRQPLLGRDVAGIVDAVGTDVTDLAPGDRVHGEVTTGALAEQVLVAADQLVRRPAELTAVEAGVLPVSGATALQGLRDAGRLRAGQHVLVHGASGGVGHLAVQIARAFGAEVTGVAGPANLALVRELGAHDTVDHTTTDPFAVRGRYDLVFDLVGDRPLAEMRRSLRPGGAVVLAAGGGGPVLGPLGRIAVALATGPFVRARLRPLAASCRRDDLETLRTMIDAGDLRPRVARTFPLARAREAYAAQLAGTVRPKLAIEVPASG
ncbi:NAD(P)-dependent alcohol dehydrogenase [Nitriliruptoraceae bacterium ZYF776]|nr:NAD(P)-dependent alcohol dehydrogenase [Profundirhabdus halotolerans]